MSPIGRPSSVLDVMNVTDVSADDQELSLYGPEPVKSQPRMSTQKLPHLIKREPGSRRHTKNDMKVYRKINNSIACMCRHACVCVLWQVL